MKILWIRDFKNCRCNGEIYKWEFYVREAGILYGAVWREINSELLQFRGENRIEAAHNGTQVIPSKLFCFNHTERR